MVCKLFLLTSCFDELAVYKPATSKAANSETYVVGKGFRGVPAPLMDALLAHVGIDPFQGGTRAMLPESLVPQSFLDQVRDCGRLFARLQSDTLEEAVDLMAGCNSFQRAYMNRAKQAFAEYWIEAMRVKPLDRRGLLAPGVNLNGRDNNTSAGVLQKRQFKGTLEERRQQIQERAEVVTGGKRGREEEGDGAQDAKRPRAEAEAEEQPTKPVSFAERMMLRMGVNPAEVKTEAASAPAGVLRPLHQSALLGCERTES